MLKRALVFIKIKLIVIVVVISIMPGCASYTTIRSRPTGATVYIDNVKLGKTPLSYSDTAIAGTVTPVHLEKDGYMELDATMRKDQFALGPCIGGYFLLFPLIWVLGYKDVYEFELEPDNYQQQVPTNTRPFAPQRVVTQRTAVKVALESTIVEATGYACMGENRSRRQTELAALKNAKRNAVEFVSTSVTSETQVKNFELEEDLVAAYSNATVKVIKELEKTWYKDVNTGECFRTKIEVEVIPK